MNILTFLAMGGSSSLGSSSGSSGSSSSSGSSGSSSDHGISVDPRKCRVNSELISDLMTPKNVQCNDLCDSTCVNFMEYLGLRLLKEDLAKTLESLNHKESKSQPDFCAKRVNRTGINNRVVLGKWENSEHEPFRPSAIRTFESILDELARSGGGKLLIVAQSHAGAKLAATVSDKWRWAAA